jgi:short-subunit dehydrogenase
VEPIGDPDRGDDGLGRTALVTGASSGIGRATAQLLAAKRWDIVVIARNLDRLMTLQDELQSRYGVRVMPLVCDLGEESAAEKICAFLDSEDISVDLLINNAGYTVIGDFTEHPWSSHREFLQTITLTPIELCWRLLPGMLERGHGRIVNVSSVVALFAGSPKMTLYAPAKSALLKFSESVHSECESRGVTCTTSIPGVTESDFFLHNNMQEFFETSLTPQLWAMRPETVARQIYSAAMNGDREVIHGWHHKAALALLRHAPKSVQYSASSGIVDMGA